MHKEMRRFIPSSVVTDPDNPELKRMYLTSTCPYCEENTYAYTNVIFKDGTPGGQLKFIERCDHWKSWNADGFWFADNIYYYMFVYATSTGEYAGYYPLEAGNDQDALTKFRRFHRHHEILVVFQSETPFEEVL